MDIMIKHIEQICKYKGEHMGILQSRKHMAWYLKGFKGAAAFRNDAGRVSSLEEMHSLVKNVLEKQNINDKE